MVESLREAAISYARRGWKVLPLLPGEKVPYPGFHGVLGATDDGNVVNSWWTAWPDANIGVATGESSGFFVVDIDPRNGGDATWQTMIPEDSTLRANVITGGGGTHYYLLPRGDNMPASTKLGAGIDVQSTGKYVVVPPSLTSNSYGFTVGVGDTLQPAPLWLMELLDKRKAPKRVVADAFDPNDDRPGTRYNAETPWEEILEPHGWTVQGEQGAAQYWTRPGKTQGISASSNYQDSGLLWVFSSSTAFEADVSYSKFAAYTVLNYGGNFSDAAKSLVDRYPQMVQSSNTALTLPRESYKFSPAFEHSHFVSRYISYANKLTDASMEYHEAAALSLLGTCASGMKAYLAPYPSGLGLNLYVALVGSSTRSRKSTAQRIASSLLNLVLPTSIIPARMTTEGLIYNLAGKPGLATIWMPDEFGVMLAQVYRRDFMRGLEELLLTLYGGDDYLYMKADRDEQTKTVHVRNPYLSVLGAATPESLSLAGPSAYLGGLLPRFAVVMPSIVPDARPAGETPNVQGEMYELANSLRQVMQHITTVKRLTFSASALHTLNQSEATLSMGGVHLARLPTMLFKVASLSALSRGSAVVEDEDAAGAVVVVNRWRDGANNLMPYMRQRSEDMTFDRTIGDVMTMLRKDGNTMSRALVSRTLRLKKSVADQIESTLVEWGYLHVNRADNTWTLVE